MVSCHIFNNYLLIAIISLNIILIGAVPSELKLINVVFRHGDRTPTHIETFPNDPYINYTFFPTDRGQLTAEGKRREYKLGIFLRCRYNDFLGSLYTPRSVVAQSSDYDRTKMSLQLVLASLFPPRSIQQWNPILNWQPIPTSYLPYIDDNIFLSTVNCPQYHDEYNRTLSSPKGQAMNHQFKDLMGNLTKLTGKKIETIRDLFSLYETFEVESSLGLLLPEWACDYFPDGPLFDGAVAYHNISNFTPLLRRLNAGPMIRTMTDNMIAAQNSTAAPSTKIYLYSGHDINIAAMLYAFGVYWPHFPAYSSAVILELQQIEQKYYVKLVYYQGILPTFKVLKIPGCDMLCPFDKFLVLIKDLIPSDKEMICHKR